MTADTSGEPGWVPPACTLPTAEQPLRQAEFDALFSTALRAGVRLDGRRLQLTLVGEPSLRAAVEDLAARETECCSFFAFTVTSPAPGRVVLDVEVPAAHTDVLDALARRADAVADAR
ncbi:hypothetical protein AB0B31_15280 [Catellatospora citrea]|uniref:hypothetical protein n=1 Tax=Catellatospora citrea TaxID=53366 RepID=UPI0033D0ED7C